MQAGQLKSGRCQRGIRDLPTLPEPLHQPRRGCRSAINGFVSNDRPIFGLATFRIRSHIGCCSEAVNWKSRTLVE